MHSAIPLEVLFRGLFAFTYSNMFQYVSTIASTHSNEHVEEVGAYWSM